MLGDGILLCLALLDEVKGPVAIDLVPLVASIGEERGDNSDNHYQMKKTVTTGGL